MNYLNLIEKFHLGGEIRAEKNKEIRQLFNGPRRQIIEIKVINSEVFPKHKAAEPITVFCVSGKGIFRAGENLHEILALTPGTLITLEANIDHDVVSDPELWILITKFKEI